MAGLTGKTIASGYKSLLRVDDDANGIDATTEAVTDGEGTKSCLRLADDSLLVQPQNDDGTAFRVATKGGAAIFTANTTGLAVFAGTTQTNVLTQYAYFGIDNSSSSNYLVDTHYPIPFSGYPSSAVADVDFGTGTDPDDIFTTANVDTQYASMIVPMMWFVPDSISIDSVTSIEGADLATGDTTRMHLKSFTFNHNSTSCLTAGALLAHNPDVTNDGNEQAYKSSWTVDEASVMGSRVILAFFRQDGTNSDYSINITIKYHIS